MTRHGPYAANVSQEARSRRYRDGEQVREPAKTRSPGFALNANITRMDDVTAQAAADQQIAEATAAELESLSLECRADAARLQRLLAPDFHEFGTSGTEIGYEGTAAMVAATDPGGAPIRVENMRGWLLADGIVMLKYTSESEVRRSNRTSLWRRTASGQWQIFHHQGTLATS